MAGAEQELKAALETALALSEAAGDTLISAKIADCLWVLSRRVADRHA
jgi:hypothetical protein